MCGQDIASALGHDLSFVKYVFLMEPIWDRAEELQVISRAHRLGAVETIEVEKLVSCDTIEAMMEEGTKPQKRDERERIAKIEKQKKRDEEHKRNGLLMSLKLLRNEPSAADGDERASKVPKTVRFAW